MGVFEFIIVLVLISTIGKVVGNRHDRRALAKGPVRSDPGELSRLLDTLEDVNTRLARLEEERDFYRKLLEAPEGPKGIPSGEGSDGSE